MPRACLAHGILSLPLLAMLATLALGLGSESEVEAFFHAHRAAHPLLKSMMQMVSDWSNAAFYPVYAWILIQGLRSKDKGRVRLALAYVAVQLLVALLAVRLLKMSLGRPRPGNGSLFMPMTADPGHHSMPSGHTTEIFGATAPLALRARGLAAPLLLGLACGVTGFSRIYLGWHHPSDVLAGWALGSLAGIAIHVIATRKP